ncbi:MAG TPA: UvrD-helicase domain-containing protein [Mycobacteriales bacterium]|jgi:superfamily I DNA/RNA helicase|nr:UvrD-helicase domain-containing protein [Mycobacteriales bacterium]
MVAGESAWRHAEDCRRRALEYGRLAGEYAAEAERFELAGRTEAQVGWRLSALDVYGWTLLADRRWPGTRDANVDAISVGPGGVLVVDVKAWAEPRVEDGRLYRGDEDCQDALDAVTAIAELAEQSAGEVGLAPLAVVPVIVLAGQRGLNATLGRVAVIGEYDLPRYCVSRGRRLDEEQRAQVLEVLERDFPPYDAPPALFSPVVADPVLPAVQPELFDVDELVAADLASVLAEPIESWMTWLHPDQARLVARSWNGPSRITGPAGTGKTVVGLHRVAYLARTRPGRLLWVSYVKTLSRTMRACYERMAPDTLERVDFTNLHAWAHGLLRDRGVAVRVDPAAARAAFDGAWERVGERGALRNVDQSRTYWREEIDRVVKGRGLTAFAQYRDLDRIGRRTALRAEHRKALWDLYEAYEAALREARAHDFNDVLAMALAEVRARPLDPEYAAVVVDEVQDLTCVGLRLLHAVSGDRPDALVLIGDGTQAVYPGGFTFAEAGVAVVGRSVRLRTNYRNAAEILAAAARVGATAAYDDGDAADDGATTVVRPGGRAVPHEARTVREHDDALVAALRHALARPGVRRSDVAVLAAHRHVVGRYLRLLRRVGLDVVDLADHDGRPDDRVRVGTFKRAKGLEFKYVLLPQLDPGDLPRQPDESDAAYRERRELAARELYVGMTRARDGLWLGTVAEEARATA